MNFNNQQSSDDLIDRELQALRMPVESKDGIGGAILAMKAQPRGKKALQLKWPIGIGSVAVAAGSWLLVGSLTTGKAYAKELHEISAAQLGQKTMIEKAYNYVGHSTPDWVTEEYVDHNREAFYQFRGDRLDAVTICDGIRKYAYGGGSSGNGNPSLAYMPYAQIDEDKSEHWTIQTVDSTLNDDYFRTRKIEKQTGVNLNGRTCDYYSLANGYYRIWVDPATKLPIQREIYSKGVTLWERDTYEYPSTMPEAKFQPPSIPEVPVFDYIATRKNLVNTFSQPGQVKKVGDVTISLKAVVKDDNQITALWTTSGLDGRTDNAVNLQVEGAQNQDTFGEVVETNLPSVDRLILNARLRLIWGQPFKTPTTVKIAAWTGDHGKVDKDGKPLKKIAGWATFTVDDVINCPHIENLLHKPVGGGGGVAMNATKKG